MIFLSLTAFFLFSVEVRAAPCCASNVAAPAIVTGDDHFQTTAVTSVSRYAGGDTITQAMRLDAAGVVLDRWQLGIGASAQAFRLGDIRLSGAFEILPEWTYSVWKPKGFVFLQSTIPMGHSIYDAVEPGAVDAVSRGFFAASFGGLFLKRVSIWDGYAIPEMHYSFARTFAEGEETLRVSPGWGASATLGVGLSPGSGRWRVGIRSLMSVSQPKSIATDGAVLSSPGQSNLDLALESSLLVQEGMTLFASYTDQVLAGVAVNTSLSRIFAVGIQLRI